MIFGTRIAVSNAAGLEDFVALTFGESNQPFPPEFSILRSYEAKSPKLPTRSTSKIHIIYCILIGNTLCGFWIGNML